MDKRKTLPFCLKYTFRVLAGLVFLFSATAKLISIDSFEIYVFSFKFLSLPLAYLSARLLIALEFGLGAWLILNFDPKASFWSATGLLAVFSVFLAVQALSGITGNCNCFGDLVEMNPVQSLLKNLAIAAILALSYGVKAFSMPRRRLIRFALAATALAAVFIASPPDNWDYERYGRSTTVNESELAAQKGSDAVPQNIYIGEKVVSFYSLYCPFCQMSARKISVLRERGEFSDAQMVILFGGEDTAERRTLAENWLSEQELPGEEYHFIAPEVFLKITNGDFPLTLLLNEGEVREKFSYRDIH